MQILNHYSKGSRSLHNKGKCIKKHKNLSYLFTSTFKKFIKNINGFFGVKPSKSQALLQVYVRDRRYICVPHENAGKQTFQPLSHANLEVLKTSPEKPGDWDLKPGDFQNMCQIIKKSIICLRFRRRIWVILWFFYTLEFWTTSSHLDLCSRLSFPRNPCAPMFHWNEADIYIVPSFLSQIGWLRLSGCYGHRLFVIPSYFQVYAEFFWAISRFLVHREI